MEVEKKYKKYDEGDNGYTKIDRKMHATLRATCCKCTGSIGYRLQRKRKRKAKGKEGEGKGREEDKDTRRGRTRKQEQRRLQLACREHYKKGDIYTHTALNYC